jgi:acetyl-CoA carboxylase carboxyltransferase component
MSKIGKSEDAGFNRIKSEAPKKNISDVFGLLPFERSKPYNMVEIIECITDNSEFEQYKELYGKSILTGYARIDGWAVGIVANQRMVVKNKKGEMQIGGVIYSDSADKATRFILNCNQKKIPLIFLNDVTGFMVGSKSEHGGIIKDGAKMVNAVSNSVVPKISIVMGNSYGAGNYAMCGKAYDPRFIFAWPNAKIAVMGGEQAAKTLLQIQTANMKSKGSPISEEEEKKLLDQITQRYEKQTTPYYAAARLWVDEIINPAETRNIISECLSASNHAPIKKQFNPGVLQT